MTMAKIIKTTKEKQYNTADRQHGSVINGVAAKRLRSCNRASAVPTSVECSVSGAPSPTVQPASPRKTCLRTDILSEYVLFDFFCFCPGFSSPWLFAKLSGNIDSWAISGLCFAKRILGVVYHLFTDGYWVTGSERERLMTKSFVDPTSIRATRIPIVSLGIALLAIIVFVRLGSMAHAGEKPVRMSNSTDMIGKLVKDHDGKNLGMVKDLIINWRSDGYIEYAVVSFGGFLGLGDEYFAVPWKALTPSDNKDHLILNMKKEDVKAIPGFVVYRFYDRSSATAQRGSRSTLAPSDRADRVMKGDIGSDLNVTVARSFSMQYATEAEFHR